ncbi:hypothetical protein DRF59_18165 [Chryseobacterium flavum]|uniref:Uncharacterized protein n=1 Tax=Chryseobacterium flavum TaxID=415851 RepID=A0A3D9CGX5_9FLAO|nr:hypothetical protein [Chryseobacterium flavum]REC65018.1 hypothetical protein DRF59_18165 [Chryseobacterium flavum]
MKKSFVTADNEGKLILKSVKLTQPLVKPEIKDAVLPTEIHTGESAKKSILTKLINQLKRIRI